MRPASAFGPGPVPKDRPMQYTTLGRTSLKVSVAGFGAGGNSRVGQGRGLTVDQSVALLREAFDLGVNFVDTAEAYGTEEIVGKAVAQVPRDGVVVSTKAGIRRGDRWATGAEVVESMEASLKRLTMDHVEAIGSASCRERVGTYV